MPRETPALVAVALNPSWDRTLEVPNFEIGKHQRGRLLSVQAAGKAVNVARLLDALGSPSVLTGFVGESDRDRFAATFEKTRVRVEMFETSGPTRENITLVDTERKVDTHVRDLGFTVTDEDIARITRKLRILSGKGAYVLLTGSLPPGMDAEAFAGLIDVCARKGARVAVDSSGAALGAIPLAKDLWLAKPNREELATIAGRPVDSEEAIREAAEALRPGLDEVVVTLGADGAMVFAREGTWIARPSLDPTAVINTVGSGDALLAGYVHRHAAGENPEACLRYGVACGTAATLQIRAGQINTHDVQAALEKVQVESLT